MKVKIEIKMDNSAFHDDCNGTEVGRILRELACKVEGSDMYVGDSCPAMDINGNRVGELKVIR